MVVCGDLGDVPANRSSALTAGDTGMLGVTCFGWLLFPLGVLFSGSLLGLTYRWVEKLLTSGDPSSEILMHSSLSP